MAKLFLGPSFPRPDLGKRQFAKIISLRIKVLRAKLVKVAAPFTMRFAAKTRP